MIEGIGQDHRVGCCKVDSVLHEWRLGTKGSLGWRATLTLSLVAMVLLPACGAGDASGEDDAVATSTSEPAPEEVACRPIAQEPLDPSSALHVLAGAPEPDYLTDQPTSGPHLTGATPEGVHAEPLSRPAQVLLLEHGGVLLQHRDLAPAEQAELEALAGEGVVVAPNPDLPAPVVATAWIYKRTCTALDIEAVRTFIDERAGQGPDGH